MRWVVSLLLSALVLVVSSELVAKPPTIEEIGLAIGNPQTDSGKFKALTEPQDYLVPGSTSGSPLIKNRLQCKASNADDIHWEYRKLKTDSWNTTLPTVIQTKTPVYSTDKKFVTLEIDDGETSAIEDLAKLNGYYRCVAEYKPKGYKAMSAPVRIVIPYVAQVTPTQVPVPGTPTVNQSFSIPCFQDISRQLVPEDAADFAPITIKWQRRIGGESIEFPENYDGAIKKERFSIDPQTGTLYYAYMVAEDRLPSEESIRNGPSQEASLQCFALIGSQPTPQLVSHYTSMSVAAAQGPTKQVEVVYPETELEGSKEIVKEAFRPECASGEPCKVITIFGGLQAAGAAVRGKSPEEDEYTPDPKLKFPGFQFTAPIVANPLQRYEAILYNPLSPSEVYKTLYVDIKINNYPVLSDRTLFPDSKNQISGKDVEFMCEAEYAEDVLFYINGQQVSKGTPPYVTSYFQKGFTVANVRREDSFSVQCVSTSAAGSLYSTSILNVYDDPVLTQFPKASDPYQIDEGYNGTDFTFNCSATIDSKLTNPKMYWMSNRQGLENVKITTNDELGVKSVLTNNDGAGIMTSVLVVEITLDSQSLIRNTEWYCVLDYTVLDDSSTLTKKGDPVEFNIIPVLPTTAAPVKGTEHLPLILGVVVGVIFLVALILLINCYVQKNRGEQYYVGDREEQAGHNPTEEMKQYGFVDYTRPDQNPIKGSRASMNLSEGKPMESDTGSLDEYGADMDASRYNEDGSFIGQYGQNGQPMRNQADV